MGFLDWLLRENAEGKDRAEARISEDRIPVYTDIRQLLESRKRAEYRKRPDIAALKMGACGNMAEQFLRASDDGIGSGRAEPPSGRVLHSDGQAFCSLYVDPQVPNFVRDYNNRPDIPEGKRLSKCVCKHLSPLTPTAFSLGGTDEKDTVYRCDALRPEEQRIAESARNTEIRNRKRNGNGSRYPR